MSKTLLKTIEGIEVFVDEEGRFSAKIAGKDVKKRTLRDIEKEIEATSSAVTAYKINRHSPSGASKVEIVGFENRRARLKDGYLVGRFDPLYLLDMETLSKVSELSERYRRISEEWNQLINSLPQVTSENFSEARKSQS